MSDCLLEQIMPIKQLQHIMLRDELTQKCFSILDTRAQSKYRFRKLNRPISYRPYLDQLFSKRDFYFIKLAKINKKWNFANFRQF
jgi:hypothetical protein